MFSKEEMERWRAQGAKWREKNAAALQRRQVFKTPSQVPVQQVYTPEDIRTWTICKTSDFPVTFPI